MAGFVIQHDWDQWNDLLNVVKGEVSTLRSLWLWSEHVPNHGMKLKEALRQYVMVTILYEWRAGSFGESDTAAHALIALQEEASSLFRGSALSMAAMGIIGDLLRHREHRLQVVQGRMPVILKATVGFADGLVFVLSLFIGVQHLWFDYLFTLVIALLAYAVYLVIDDLDHPLQPGIWHATATPYEHLLTELQRKLNP